MADFNRDIGDVQPRNYIRPGVERPNAAGLAAGLFDVGVKLDQGLAQERFKDDLENLAIQHDVGSPAAIAVQEEAEQLSAADQRQVDAVKNDLTTASAAVDQGRMTIDTFRIRGERLLRMAISKRPGLAQEFRAAAAYHLGVDVVGAGRDVLAAGEAALQRAATAEKKGGPDYTRQRNHLDAVGVPSGLLTDEQVSAVYTANIDAISAHLKQQAENEVVTTAAGTLKAGQELRRPGATAAFTSEVGKVKLDVYKKMSTAWAAFSTGQLSPEQQAQVITNGNAMLSGQITALRSSLAQGDVDPAIAEKELTGLEELQRQLQDLASGKTTNELQDNKIKGTILYLQNAMLDNENVAVMAAATKTFGPEIMTQFTGPGGAFNKQAALALGDTLNNTGRPLTRAASSGNVASAVISSVLDRGGGKTNPESIPAMGQTLINAGQSFAELTPKEFRSDYLTGPFGYMTVLDRQAPGLAKSLPDQQKIELSQTVALAASANRQALSSSFGRKYPALVSKVIFRYNPATGDFIQPKGALTAAESAAVRQYNTAFAGKKVSNIIKQLTGADDAQVAELVGSATNALLQQAPTTEAPTAGAGSNWWESF